MAVTSKRCPKCETVLDAACFHKNKARKDGLADRCKNCYKQYSAQKAKYHEKWRTLPENIKKIKERTAKWRKDNPEQNKENVKRWTEEHADERRDYFAKYQRERRATDVDFKLRGLLRGRINSCIRFRKRAGKWSGKKAGSHVRDLGCSITQLISYMEDKFTPEMTWDNHGAFWEIDHVVPLANFDLTDRKQFLKACHFTNLQPLGIDEHLEKTTRELADTCNLSTGQ